MEKRNVKSKRTHLEYKTAFVHARGKNCGPPKSTTCMQNTLARTLDQALVQLEGILYTKAHHDNPDILLSNNRGLVSKQGKTNIGPKTRKARFTQEPIGIHNWPGPQR